MPPEAAAEVQPAGSERIIEYFAVVGCTEATIQTALCDGAKDAPPTPTTPEQSSRSISPFPGEAGGGSGSPNTASKSNSESSLPDVVLEPQVLQRIPAEDHEGSDFPLHVSMFCFPDGLRLSSDYREPRCSGFTLTEVDGGRSYCSALMFWTPLLRRLPERTMNQTYGPLKVPQGKGPPVAPRKQVVVASVYSGQGSRDAVERGNYPSSHLLSIVNDTNLSIRFRIDFRTAQD